MQEIVQHSVTWTAPYQSSQGDALVHAHIVHLQRLRERRVWAGRLAGEVPSHRQVDLPHKEPCRRLPLQNPLAVN